MFKRGTCLLALCLLLSLCACSGPAAAPGGAESVSAQASVSAQPEPEPEPSYIQYPGFVDQYFDSENHVLILGNSEENQVDFLFELSNYDGKQLFKSEAVKPGEETGWDVTQAWKHKKHKLTITATPVNADGSLGNPVSQTITVTVELDE